MTGLVFLLAILGLGILFIMVLLKPRLMVLLLLGFYALWPSYVAIIVPGAGAITPQRVLVLLLLMAWLVQIVHVRAIRCRLLDTIAENRLVFFSVFVYYFFGIITGSFASAMATASIASGVASILFYPMTLIFVISYFATRREILQLFFIIILLAVLVETIGIVEWVYQGNLFALFVDPVSDTAQEMMTGKLRDDVYRIQSTFTNPLAFAEFLLLIIPISMYFFSPRRSGVSIRILAAVQIVLGLFCIHLTGSRASTLLVIIIFLSLAIYKFKNRVSRAKIIFGVTSLVLMGVIFIPWGLLANYLIGDGETASSTLGRLYQLELGIPAVLSSPIWGHGLTMGVLYVAPLDAIDNYYLTAAIETGLLGLAFLLIYQISTLKLALRSNTNVYFPSIGVFAAVAFMGLFVNELTLSIIQPFTFFFVIVGGLMVIRNIEKNSYSLDLDNLSH